MPSSKTTSDATTSLPCTWLTSTHSMRSGAVSRPSASCSSCNAAERAVRSPALRSLCWANASAALRATVSISARLSPRCGTRMCTFEPRSAPSHSASASASSGSSGTSTSRGTGLPPDVGLFGQGRLFAVELAEELGRPATSRRPARRPRRPCRSPSRAGRAPGRRARGTPARPLRVRPARRRRRRRRCRRRSRRPASPAPAAARRRRRAAGPRARTPARRTPGASRVPAADQHVGLAGEEVAEVQHDVPVLAPR